MIHEYLYTHVSCFPYIVALWVFTETFLLAGLNAGWASLVYVLKKEHIYGYLCEKHQGNDSTSPDVSYQGHLWNYTHSFKALKDKDLNQSESLYWVDDGACSLQDDKFQLCVTVSLILSAPLCLLLSRLNYRYGMRTTRLVSITLLVMGSASFGLISTDFPWLIFPGYLGVLVGGIGILQTNFQVSYMFDKYGSTVIGALSGSFDASGSVLLLTKIAYEDGISLEVSFFIICASNVILVISTFIFLPKDFIQRRQHQPVNSDTEINNGKSHVHLSENTRLVAGNHDARSTNENAVLANNDKPSFQESNMAVSKPKGDNSVLLSYVLNPLYLLQVVWATVNILIINLFLGSLNSWLEKVVKENDEKVSYYTNISYYAMLTAPVFSLLSGVVVDSSYFFQSDRKKEPVRTLHSLVVPSAFTSITGSLLCVGIMAEKEEVMYCVAITSVIYRATIYSFCSSNLRLLYPTEYFGALYGCMMCLGGMINFLTYPLFLWCQSSESGYRQVYGTLCVTALITLSLPVYLLHLARTAQDKERTPL